MQYPFSPEILDALPEAAARHFRALETELLQMICQQLKTGQMNEVSVQAIRTLRSHGIPLKDIETAIQRHTALSRSELNSLLNDVVQRNQAYYTSTIDMAGLTAPDTLAGAADIAAISMQTAAELENITQSIGFVSRAGRDIKLSEAYTWALDQAALKVQSGAASYNAAIADAVKQLADSGIRYIDYESGHRDRADVAVRRAVMTGIAQLNAKYAEQSVDYLETDLVEVTAHMGARNTGGMPENHELWQGRVYRWAAKTKPDAPQSSGEYPDFIRCTGYGDVQGLEGANCRHHYFPFVEGVSERTYTDEQLEQMKAKKFEYEGKEYDTYTASQKQRQIERTVRKLTRERDAYKAAGLTDDATAVNVKLRRLKQKYTEFSKAAGLPEQRERMKVLGHYRASGNHSLQSIKKAPPTLQKRNEIQDVTEEYARNASPNSGNITYEDGYKVGKHRAEIETAEWLHSTYGGDIKLLTESTIRGEKRAEYLWRERFWELKSCSSINAVDKRLQDAIHQIEKNPGGVIIDISGTDLALKEIERQTLSRVKRSKINNLDVILLKDWKTLKILRYNK